MKKKELSPEVIDRVIEMAWEDRTPFDAIQTQFDLPEKEVIKIMRNSMKKSSFLMWRERVQNRKTKHLKKVEDSDLRFKCSRQRQISNNHVSKR
ncbi:MAG: TIGR03643 family protein [bacterium]|nr:TIGR03643 family protein [bacterium]